MVVGRVVRLWHAWRGSTGGQGSDGARARGGGAAGLLALRRKKNKIVQKIKNKVRKNVVCLCTVVVCCLFPLGGGYRMCVSTLIQSVSIHRARYENGQQLGGLVLTYLSF